MTVWLAAFTQEGARLGERLTRGLTEMGCACRLFAPNRLAGGNICSMGSLAQWTEQAFQETEGLVFIGASGIAVRAVAPYLRGKDRDPAVVVVDQKARFSVALLSGHLGGANRLARDVAGLCGAQPVITTATDVCNVFAVDTWAADHNVAVLDVDKIKTISGRILSGETVGLSCDFPMDSPPEGFFCGPGPVGVSLSLDGTKCPFPVTLRLVPRIAFLGMGCRKDTSQEQLEAAALIFLEKAGISIKAVAAVCTADLKAAEPGLLAFCEKYGFPLRTFSPEVLMAQKGAFSASSFVKQVTGADNVCERAAVAGCGPGTLFCPKTVINGVTVALAVKNWKAVFSP